jgi:hypothetical protein
MTPEARFWAILGLIVAVAGIGVPVLLDKSGAVNFPIINFQPAGLGSGGDGFPTVPTAFPTPEETVEVPPVTGSEEQAAKDTLAGSGLSGVKGFTTPTALCSQESGEVESTLPPEGTKVPKGTQVSLVVCE